MSFYENEAALINKRDEWFERLQSVFDGTYYDPKGFRIFGIWPQVTKHSYCEEPEEWVDEGLEDIAANHTREIFDENVFKPPVLQIWDYGVHYIDRIFGANVLENHGQLYTEYINAPVGSLEEPDLDNNDTFRFSLRAAKHFASSGDKFTLFALPVIASPLNIAVNLYGEEFLVSCIDEPEAARKDLETIARVQIKVHETFRRIIPAKQLQLCVGHARIQPPGYGQICGCSTHLVSGQLYGELISDLDDAVLGVYEHGGMIHLCGGHTQHIEVFRKMPHLSSVQLNDRAAGDLKQYFEGLREDQIIYVHPCPEMPLSTALEITQGRRLVIWTAE